MSQKYRNEMLCQSREEIKKVWDNCWEKIQSLDPMKDFKELVELNKQFDKCVEAYHAEDCGSFWKVRKASVGREGPEYYIVRKERTNDGGE